MVKRSSIKRLLLRSRLFSFERLVLVVCSVIVFLWIFRSIRPSSTIKNEFFTHRSKIYDISNPFVMINLIDQFLDTTDSNSRDGIWPILIQSWSKSFETFVKRSEHFCSSKCSSSFDFLSRYFDHYKETILLDNLLVQRYLTGFGLFFDYDPRQMRMKTHHQTYEIQLSECDYFDLIVLLMKIQLVFHRFEVSHFLSRQSLIGAIRHHDILPWTSIVAFNLPVNMKKTLIEQIPNQFDLILKPVNNSSVDQGEIESIYKTMTNNKSWPHVELIFYNENDTDLFGSTIHLDRVKKTDVFPIQLRPFGPLLLPAMNNPSASITKENLHMCEIQSSNSIESTQQLRTPCEQLTGTFEFVRSTKSWRQGFCEETLKKKNRPYRTFSYFRYICFENQTSLFR